MTVKHFGLNRDENGHRKRSLILLVTGPNQGGKTTFARAFGQLHYLASIGCPVPGSDAQLTMFDRLFTHFEQEESMATLRGKLKDDLVRIYDILEIASGRSIIILNEIFSSTSLQDARALGLEILEKIARLDCLCVCVTFLDELSTANQKIVSLVAGMSTEDPVLRTFKIERRPADGLSYAEAIAEKYQLSYLGLQRRLRN
jgi:DNA mismatch repair protein MutS